MRYPVWSVTGRFLLWVILLAGCGGDARGVAPAAVGDLSSGAETQDHSAPPTADVDDGAPLADDVVAVIGDRVITVEEVERRIASSSPFLRARYQDADQRREFVDSMIRFELLAAEARRRGYGEHPEVVRAMQQSMVQRMLQEGAGEAGGSGEVSEGEVAAYYHAHLDEFRSPEMVRASHIVIADRARAQDLLRQIRAAPDDVRLFRELASAHSEDAETRMRGGDLRFFSRSAERRAADVEVPNPLVRTAFALARIGEVHPSLVQTPVGYHIVKLTGRRAALNRTLEEAASAIRARLSREHRAGQLDALVSELRERAHVRRNDEAIDRVSIEQSPVEPTP